MHVGTIFDSMKDVFNYREYIVRVSQIISIMICNLTVLLNGKSNCQRHAGAGCAGLDKTGVNGNIIRLTPALVINESQVDASLQALSIVLSLLDLQNRS